MSAVIAAVDDDPEMLDLLKLVLGKEGFKVNAYPTPGKFFDGVMKSKPSVCLVDVQLPGMDGREIIRVLRSNAETRDVCIIAMSSAAKTPQDMVRGLENGADEYFPKPLDMELLLARIKNLLARSGGRAAPPPDVLRWGPLEVFPDEHAVKVSGKSVPLTRLEFRLLETFLRQPERVLARSWLLETVWASPGAATRTVDKHVEALRKKLPVLGERLETVVGVGYLFRP